MSAPSATPAATFGATAAADAVVPMPRGAEARGIGPGCIVSTKARNFNEKGSILSFLSLRAA